MARASWFKLLFGLALPSVLAWMASACGVAEGDFGLQSGGPDGVAGAWVDSGSAAAVGGSGGSPDQEGSGGSTDRGGSGGSPDQEDPPNCDDANPCTFDTLEADNTCAHEPVADGTPCDDGLACTHDDQCFSGVCAPLEESVRQVLDSVEGFGISNTHRNQGLAAVLTPDRLVMSDMVPGVSGASLTLLAVEENGVSPVSRVMSPLPVDINTVDPWIWSWVRMAQLVRLTDTRFAFVSAWHGIEIYDTVGDEITLASSTLRGWWSPLAYDSVGNGDDLWICEDSSVRRHAVAGGGSLSEPEYLPTGACHALTLSPDGDHLYAATRDGLYVVPLLEEAEPKLIVEGRLLDVEASADYVAIRYTNAPHGFGDIAIYHAADIHGAEDGAAPEPAFTLPFTDLSDTPTGFGFLSGEFFVQQLSASDDGSPPTTTLLTYDLDEGLESPTHSLLVDQNDTERSHQPERLAAGSGLVVTEPARRIVRHSDSSLEALTAPGQGSFESLLPIADDTLAAFDQYSAHRITLGATGKLSLEGGAVLDPGVSTLRLPLVDHVSQAPYLQHPIEQETKSITLFDAQAEPWPQPVGASDLAGAPARFSSAGERLYQLAQLEESPTFRVRAYELADIQPAASPQPKLEAEIEVPVEPAARSWAFGVAADSDALVLATVHEIAEDDYVLSLAWYAVREEDLQLLAQRTFPTTSTNVRSVFVVQDRAAVQVSKELKAVRRHGEKLRLVETVHHSEFAEGGFNLRAFDGSLLHLSLTHQSTDPDTAEISWHTDVVALRFSDLSVVARYPDFPDALIGVTRLDSHVVFNTRNGVFVVEPACE